MEEADMLYDPAPNGTPANEPEPGEASTRIPNWVPVLKLVDPPKMFQCAFAKSKTLLDESVMLKPKDTTIIPLGTTKANESVSAKPFAKNPVVPDTVLVPISRVNVVNGLDVLKSPLTDS